MELNGGALGVHMPQGGQPPPPGTALVCRPEGCPSGYTRVEVVDVRPLVNVMHYAENPSKAASKCVTYTTDSSTMWLNGDQLFNFIKSDGSKTAPSSTTMKDTDMVPTLVCSGPHPNMINFFTRHRSVHWPFWGTLNSLYQMPALLVLVGPKGYDDPHLYCRFSFSHMELLLFNDMPCCVKRAHIMFKYTFLALLRKGRDYVGCVEPSSGRSKVGSFHLKTVLLYSLEKNPPADAMEPFEYMLTLFDRLRIFLKQGRLPHYFLPECDLLTTVDYQERQLALEAVHTALNDPIEAVLFSPLEPDVVYGPNVSIQKLNELIQNLRQLEPQLVDENLRPILDELNTWRKQQYSGRIVGSDWNTSWYAVSDPPEYQPICLLMILDRTDWTGQTKNTTKQCENPRERLTGDDAESVSFYVTTLMVFL